MVYLFKFDSTHGWFKGDVRVEDEKLVINGNQIFILMLIVDTKKMQSHGERTCGHVFLILLF